MINTGLLMRKPGESNYGRFRRFKISNHSIHLKLVKTSVNKFPRGQFRLAKFATVAEKRFLKNHEINKFQYLFISKPYYRPQKCCPECMKVGYHSYVFDYKWMFQCPVHKCELVDYCPTCESRWPTLTDMNNRTCRTCGSKLDINLLKLETGHCDNPYYVFELIQEIIEHRSKRYLTEASVCISDEDRPNYLGHKYKKNDDYLKCPLEFSILTKLKIITPFELKILAKVCEIQILPMTCVKEPFIRYSHKNLYNLDQSDLINQKELIDNEAEKLILRRLNLTKCSCHLNACINDFGIHARCLPLVIFLIIIGNSKSVTVNLDIYYWHMLKWIVAFRKAYTKNSIVLGDLIGQLLLNEPTKNQQHKHIKIPDNVSLNIYKVELYNIIKKVFLEVEKFQENKVVDWNNVVSLTSRIVNSNYLKELSLSIVLKNQTLTAIIPSHFVELNGRGQ